MTILCSKCNADLGDEDGVFCVCGTLHYECAGINETIYRKRSADDKAAFKCVTCRKSEKEQMKDLIEELRTEIRQNHKDTQKRLEEVIKSQEFLSRDYDEMKVQLAGVLELERKVAVLEEDLAKRDKTIEELQSLVRGNEQYLRRRQLEICGVPKEEEEKLVPKVIEIAKVCSDVIINPIDIDAVHRVPIKNKTDDPPIIIEFNSRRVRDQILANRYKNEIKNNKGNRIFINESLSPFFRKLLGQAKTFKRDHGFQHCWFSRRCVNLKRSDTSKIFRIYNEEDLNKLKKVMNNE